MANSQSASGVALQPIFKKQLSLLKIINSHYNEILHFLDDDEMSDELYDALFDHYTTNGEMPYGVAKARTGDPMQWIAEKFQSEFK